MKNTQKLNESKSQLETTSSDNKDVEPNVSSDSTTDEQKSQTEKEINRIDETSCSSSTENTESNTSKEKKPDSTDCTNKIIDESGDDNLIDVEDPDDYLLYLETILMKIHSRFYSHYDENKQVSLN